MWQPKVITCEGFDERELVLHVRREDMMGSGHLCTSMAARMR